MLNRLFPIAIACVCLVVPGVRAQVDPEALDLLENSTRAWAEVDSLTADVTLRATDMLAGFVPETTGYLQARRLGEEAGAWQFRASGSAQATNRKPEIEFDAAWDRTRSVWVDHAPKTWNRARRGKGDAFSAPQQLVSPDLFMVADFNRELAADSITLDGSETIAGEECSIVTITMDGQKERWAIAKSDGLPRRITSISTVGRLIHEFSNLKTGVALADADFEVPVPAGYETIEQVQPQVNPTPRQGDRLNPRDERAMQPQQRTVKPAEGVPAPRQASAPDFALKNPQGEAVTLESLRGQVVVLDFWGTWCLPCKKASPLVQKLHEDYNDKGVKVLGLAVRERDPAKPIAYMAEQNYTYGLLLEADQTAKDYGVKFYPTFVVIGHNGEIIHRAGRLNPGMTYEDVFEGIRKVIDNYLTGKPTSQG